MISCMIAGSHSSKLVSNTILIRFFFSLDFSDSLLNFPNLTVFKQESQSPTQESRKNPRNNQVCTVPNQTEITVKFYVKLSSLHKDAQNLSNHQHQSSAIIENTQRFRQQQEHAASAANNVLNNERNNNDSNTNNHPNNGGHQSAAHHSVSGNMMEQGTPAGGSGQGSQTMGNLQNFMQQNGGFEGNTSGGQQQQGGMRAGKLADDCRYLSL
jgi:uncharacterized membrane-anchored protein YhcB (DUF1043 family)